MVKEEILNGLASLWQFLVYGQEIMPGLTPIYIFSAYLLLMMGLMFTRRRLGRNRIRPSGLGLGLLVFLLANHALVLFVFFPMVLSLIASPDFFMIISDASPVMLLYILGPLVLFTLGLVQGVSLAMFNPKGPFWARLWLICFAAFSFIIVPDISRAMRFAPSSLAVQGVFLLYAAFWLVYFATSARVRNSYAPGLRPPCPAGVESGSRLKERLERRGFENEDYLGKPGPDARRAGGRSRTRAENGHAEPGNVSGCPPQPEFYGRAGGGVISGGSGKLQRRPGSVIK